MIRNSTSIIIIAVCVLFTVCATMSPRRNEIRQLGLQTFGTEVNLKVHEVFYAGPLSSGLTSALGNTNDELALAQTMLFAKKQKLDLIVWGNSSSKTALTLRKALHYPSLQSGLNNLRILFIGDSQDALPLKAAVESTGASMFFHQK